MDIKHTNIQNCLTIGHANLELDSRGLLLIQGENLDDTSSKSNGAGKSSIVDALCWCLYGETARGVSGDLIVNDTAKKDCMVSVVLDDAGQGYLIERYRKHSKHKNQLFVWQLDPAGGASVPLHKGTDKETQAVVTKIMGCSLDVFAGSIYAGQEKMPDLPGMTDKFLKLLVEEAAGVEELAEAHKHASKESLLCDRHAADQRATVSAKESNAELAKRELDEALEQRKLFEDTRKDRARAEMARVPPLQAEAAKASATLASMKVPEMQKCKADIEGRLAAVKFQQEGLERLQAVATAAVREADRTKHNAVRAKQNLDIAHGELANVEAKIGTPCGECGKAFCAHDIEGVKKLREGDVAFNKAALTTSVGIARLAKQKAEEAAAEVEAWRAKMTDVTADSCDLKTLTEMLRQAGELEFQINQYAADIEAIKVAAKAKLTEPNPWEAPAARRQAAYEKSRDLALDAKRELATLEERAELAAQAVKVFGPAGVRAHILDSVTPFLNDRTREYLGTLADGNIHAVWSTLDTTSKGELREKFNIAVTNDKGGKVFAAQSGGEKRKVRLATALALQDMVASRATKPISLFMADEIDDALDDPGLERLMTVLDTKAKERGTVLVISHNALTDWIDSVITVTKSGGKSTVAGAATRTF